MYLSWIAFIPLIFHLKVVFYQESKDFDPHLKLVALSTFVLAILFATALIIENLHSE